MQNFRAIGAPMLALAALSGTANAQELLAGVTTSGKVVTFRSNAPGSILSSATISGLNAGDRVQGIDFRPQTGEFIALGENNFIYSLNPFTGVAAPIGSGFAPALDAGVRYGIDINPTVDRLRVVGAGAQNRRLNPITGASVVPTDTTLTFNPPLGTVTAPRAVSSAYTNSIPSAPLGSVRQFILDSANNVLGEVGSQAGGNASFNGGVIGRTAPVTLAGFTLDFNDNAGFDISGTSGIAYITLNLETVPGAPTALYTIDLETGYASDLGTVGGDLLRDVTVVPAPGVGALAAAGLLAFRRRRSMR